MGGCTNLLLKLVESGENNNILVSSLSSLILVVVDVVVTEEDGIIVTSLFRDICLSVICRIGCVARRRCVCVFVYVFVCMCVCVATTKLKINEHISILGFSFQTDTKAIESKIWINEHVMFLWPRTSY